MAREPEQQSMADALAKHRERKGTTLAPGQGEQVQEGSLFSPPKDNAASMGPDYGYSRMRLHKSDTLSAYTAQQDQRYALDPRLKKTIVMGIATLCVFLLVCVLPNGFLNPTIVNTDFAWFTNKLAGNVGEIFQLLTTGTSQGTYHVVIFTAIVTAFVGAGLGACGACYQGALKNAMASPTTLGIMSGGTVGSVIYVLLNYSPTENTTDYSIVSLGDIGASLNNVDVLTYIQIFFGQALCSLAGCFIVVGIVVSIAMIAGRGKVSNTALVIAGTVISSVASAVIQLVRYYLTIVAPQSDALSAITDLQNGSAATFTTGIGVLLVVVPITLCLVALFFLRHRLNILTFSDEEARSMGINTRRTRNLMVAVCTVMTAVVVSFYGMVGMVGFMVPLIARRIVGSDARYVIPAAMLAGACFMLITYYVSTLGIMALGSGKGLGMFTSILGAIVFVVTIIKQRGRRNIDWN